MGLYEENLALIKIINPDLFTRLENTKDKLCRLEQSKSGLPSLSFLQNNEFYYIHSKYHPQRETEKIMQSLDFKADHLVVFGLGLGYLLQSIMAQKPQRSRVLLIEPELEIFKNSLKVMDWASILRRADFSFHIGKDMVELANTIPDFFNLITFDVFKIIELPAEVRFFNSFFKEVRLLLDNEIRTLLYDFKTRLAESSMVGKNILKNIYHILNTRPVKTLKNKFVGKPGFIVSAGPSLDKNILFLKKIRNRAVLICVDTALKPLLRRGINPHFTVAVDPSYKNYLHLQGTEEKLKNFLIAETAISTKVFTDFKQKIFTSSLGKPIFKMIEENIGEIGEIEAWGSVISMAVNFAIYLGLNPVIFLGQDFAFTDMRNHCRGTSWEEQWIEYTQDLDALQRREKQSIGGIKKSIETIDINGKMILTSDKLSLYKNYLTKILVSFPETKFINATEGGILSEIECRSIHDVLKQYVYNEEDIDFESLEKIPIKYNQLNKNKLIKFFRAKVNFFKNYKNKIKNSLEKLDNTEGLTKDALLSVLDGADKTKNDLYSEANLQNGIIIEMWSEAPIYEFLRKSEQVKKQEVNEKYVRDFLKLFKEYYEKILPITENVIDTFTLSIKNLKSP